DKEMMLASDYIIDIGPGAGRHGGHIVAAGHPEEFLRSDSLTARFLSGETEVEYSPERRKGNGKKIRLSGATGNNLQKVDLTLPLGTFSCITGVSGSGKSTLVHDTLFPI